MDVQRMLEEIANHQANNSFTPDYLRTATYEALTEEGLGIAIAHWTSWDGLKIMRVFFSALEDANFHTEAAQVEEMIAKYTGDDEQDEA